MLLAFFVHRIDPIITSIAGVHLWWYGLSYTLGFLQLHLFAMRARERMRLTREQVYALSLCVSLGVLAGGRLVEVSFDEWPFYREHLHLIPAYWLGGMATHGLLIGAAAGTGLFAWLYRRPFLMGVGRLGNFLDGQIVGGPTDVWWGVQFPDAAGVRHPVVLYDGLKNLALIPYLGRVRATTRTPGAAAARFVFWYAFLRIFIDLFRDYPTHRLALGTGQTLNLVMAILGAVLLYRSRQRRLGRLTPRPVPAPAGADRPPSLTQRVALATVLMCCLTIPSNWTQDVPARYGARHQGLQHSRIYPALDTAPKPAP